MAPVALSPGILAAALPGNFRDQNPADITYSRGPLGPATGGIGPSSSVAAGPVDPRDSAYWAALVRAQSQRDQAITDLRAGQANQNIDLTEGLRRLQMQRPVDEQAARLAANREGRLLSSTLGSQLGDIATGYTRREGDVRLAYDRDKADRTRRISALEATYGLDETDALLGAIGRALGRDANLAGQGALPVAAAPAVAAAPVSPQVSPPKTSKPQPAGIAGQTGGMLAPSGLSRPPRTPSRSTARTYAAAMRRRRLRALNSRKGRP